LDRAASAIAPYRSALPNIGPPEAVKDERMTLEKPTLRWHVGAIKSELP
jgi:hypothetical protein